MKFAIVTPWHNPNQRAQFLETWGIHGELPDWLFLQQDTDKSGCAATKNRGIRRAIDAGAEYIIVLDDDCFPAGMEGDARTLEELAHRHIACLSLVQVPMFQVVTDPPSRGTPFLNRTITMPVAASMGFWSEVGDYDAPSQLVYGQHHPMKFRQEIIYGRYFPLCGMNLAFRADQWPQCQFVDVPRYDDIWGGFIWQKIAYARNQCFNLNGPLVRHSRQSNVWQNLRQEAVNAEANETLWAQIHNSPETEYEKLRALVGM